MDKATRGIYHRPRGSSSPKDSCYSSPLEATPRNKGIISSSHIQHLCPKVHFLKSCFELSYKWTNVTNDPIDVSGSFCLPSLSCHGGNCLITKIIILFMKVIQWHIWTNGESRNAFGPSLQKKKKNRQDRFTLAWEDLSYTVTDIGLGFVDAWALDWCLRKFPWSCPCGWKTSTESWKMTSSPCSKPACRMSFPVPYLPIRKDNTSQRPLSRLPYMSLTRTGPRGHS